MSVLQSQKQYAEQTVSDDMYDLVNSLYRAGEILLGNPGENQAEAAAQIHWAQGQIRKCKTIECAVSLNR